ncbi:DUF4349 domain-containing protein [Nocardioides sp. Bht2]|uniref:DUF4349 domain-containing protein n=1 Tax=Nocardioides sp. Bht2 TaxID=3392297 RepID=UPI0039B37C7A
MPPRRLATLAAALAALGAIGACASSGDAEPDSAQAGGASESEPAPATDEGSDGADKLSALRDVSDAAPLSYYEEPAKADTPIRDAVIRTGTISLRSPEVATARAEIQEILDAHRGEVSNEKTTSDTEGELTHVRVVARVPSGQFATTMTALEGVATTLDSKVNAKDVTTEVIDVQARVRSQEKSLRRIEDLLASAANLDQVIAIEGQLARRQADLDSLKSRLAWLKDRTSLSTITINLGLEQADEPAPEKDDDGFLAGLGDGWDALGTATTNVATATGAATPFLALGALVGTPVWLVARHNRRIRRNEAEPAQV